MFNKKHYKFNLNSTFAKLLGSYLIIISLILTTSSLVFFRKYKKLIVTQEYNLSQKLLNQANYYVDFNIQWATSFLYSLYLDEDIYDLMFSQSSNYKKNGISKLKHLNLSSSNIDSIFIYNKFDDKFYSSLGNPAENYYLPSMKNIIYKSKNTFTDAFIPSQIKINLKNNNITKNIISIAILTSKSSEKSLSSAVILNLNANTFSNYFKHNITDNSNLFVMDNNGTILFNKYEHKFMVNESKNKFIQDILNPTKNYFIARVNGVKYFVTYKNFKNLNFVNMTPYEYLFSQSKKVTNSFLIVSLLLFILGIIISYLISHKIYTPINKIVTYVNENLPTKEAIPLYNKNEFDYISATLENALSEPSRIEKLPLEEIVFIRNGFLKELLTSKFFLDKKQFKIKSKQLKINLDMENILVLIFKIDYIDDFYKKYDSKESRSLVRLGIKNIIYDSLSLEYQNESIIVNNTVVSILNTNSNISSSLKNNILTLVKDIQNKIFNNLGISLSIAISPLAKDLSYVNKCYNRASSYIKYTFRYGNKSILHYDRIVKNTLSEYRYNNSLENSLFEAIKLGNKERTNNLLDDIFDELLKFSHDNSILYIKTLAINSKNLIDNLYLLKNEKSTLNIDIFLKNLSKYEFADSAKYWFLDLYETTINTLSDKKLYKNTETVEKAKNYIEKNYTNSLLSVELVSEYVNISPNYLRTLFKNITGESISKYINICRFENAKKLLINTDLTILDISSKVGYSNNNYFYTAFKKTYGISPSQFRRNNKE
ncbi:AraC family transcriptional regulator [Clostridium massiliodielmoense]|uniref:AraC family transcriptional regulator n=1 Tax=Clostridium massiliodielmoense TaxID=1776385 RepID=UPI00135649F3|nr:AraC family transcriptional regulator [Clostridium massiliodielmoense]